MDVECNVLLVPFDGLCELVSDSDVRFDGGQIFLVFVVPFELVALMFGVALFVLADHAVGTAARVVADPKHLLVVFLATFVLSSEDA